MHFRESVSIITFTDDSPNHGAFGNLDRFPGLTLCRGRKVVDRDLIQTGVPSDEGADSVSQILREARHRVLLARGRGINATTYHSGKRLTRSIFLREPVFCGEGASLTISQRIAKVGAPLRAMSRRAGRERLARICLVSAEDHSHDHGGEERIVRIPWSGCWVEANPISRP